MWVYGMRLRGFAPMCQPKEGFVEREDDTTGRYHDLLVYNRELSYKEMLAYELDFVERRHPINIKVGMRYNDPDGEWEITGVHDGMVDIICVGNCEPDNTGFESQVSEREVRYWMENWGKI